MPIGIAIRKSVRSARCRIAHVADQQLGIEDQEDAGDHERELAQEVDDREHDVDGHRVLDPAHVDERQQRHHRAAGDDVAGRVLNQVSPRRPRSAAAKNAEMAIVIT